MKAKHFFGKRKSDGTYIYIDSPTFDCGWYWSFGYLGNKNEHYHLSSYQTVRRVLKDEKGVTVVIDEKRNKNMFDCLNSDYELNEKLSSQLWKFCELAKTAYSLKETAEVLGRGGSHYTTNPCAAIIENKNEVKRINEVVLPAIFKEIDNIFTGV